MERNKYEKRKSKNSNQVDIFVFNLIRHLPIKFNAKWQSFAKQLRPEQGLA